PLPVEAAFPAGGPVLANRRRVTVDPAAAAFPAVADVRAAVGVLAGAACALGDCAFPVAALSAAGDAMSVADEVAADERRAAPAVHCLAGLDGLQVARDDPRAGAEGVRHRAARDDPRLVARDVRHRAVLDDLKQTHLPTSNCLNPRPVKARSYTPSFGATKARTYPALISRSRCSSGTMHCFVRCLSSS